MPKQQPPGSPEETDRHRAEGQTGRREHDPDVLQRILQGTAGLAACANSLSSWTPSSQGLTHLLTV